MAKMPIRFDIDENLLANLRAYAAQTGCTVTELIERFCQQGLEMASQGSIPTLEASHIGRGKNNRLAERLEIVETEVKSMLERLSLLESKVDVDIDVNDYLQNWEKSLELRIASLVDTFVEKHVEEILGGAYRHSGIEPSRQTIPSAEQLDAHQTDLDDEDEPDEILTEFLEPHART
ncbi:MAG: hypothetical protein JOZ78_11650 [Chroococcidiopsidaceae cyanobacterium CP_BM_ER_R8_30]|nr:hypothetical protein [Chroococcidiopsidaceae cyanobacterium CP_BM_ER_R8_30]